MTHVVVVGGGITGLACALELGDAGIEVTVLEAADRLGGSIRTSDFGGLAIDEAADAFLARVPEGVALAQRVGLGDSLVSPSNAGAYVWSRGALRRLPGGLALGVPGEIWPVVRSGILSVGGMARAAVEPVLPRSAVPPDALGPLVESRFGREVLDRLVDPLIGGINAGEADRLSAEAVSPQVAAVAAAVEVAAARVAGRPPRTSARSDGPGLLRPEGWDGRLDRARCRGTRRRRPKGRRVELSTPVESIELEADGSVQISTATSAPNRHRIAADAAVLACPAWASAALLAEIAPDVASTLRAIDHASVALVTLAFDDAAIGRVPRRHRPPGAQARAAHGDGRVVGLHEVGALEASRSGDHSRVCGPRRRRAGARPRRRRRSSRLSSPTCEGSWRCGPSRLK